MSDKTSQAQKQSKADLRKMLAEAVLNTPGAIKLEPAQDAPSQPQFKRSGVKPPGKSKGLGLSSGRGSRKVGARPKRR